MLAFWSIVVTGFLANFAGLALAEPVPASCAPRHAQWKARFAIYREDGETRLGTTQTEGEIRSGEWWLRSVTEFDDGSYWEEEAFVAAVGETLRARRYRRKFERPGTDWKAVEIDFRRGLRTDRSPKEKKTKPVEFPEDTYVGPMIGLVVRCARSQGEIDFHSLSFENHPGLHAMKARPLGEGPLPWGPGKGLAGAKVLLRADLGMVGNFLLGSLVPDNTFWISSGETGDVLGWEGPSDWKATRIVAIKVPERAHSTREDPQTRER